MRIACSTSFHRGDLDAALAQVAAMGFRQVDLICIPGWDHILPARAADEPEAVVEEAARMLAVHQLTPIAGNVALGNLYQRDSGHDQRLREAEGVALLLQQLGVRKASFYPGYKTSDRPWDEVLADEAASIRELLAIGSNYGVTFCIELHKDTPFETVEQGRRLLEAVPELGVAYDPSHYAMQSIPLADTAPFLDRAVHVHLRSAAPGRMQAPMAEGTVDFDWLLSALSERDYPGDCSIEYLPGLEREVTEEIIELRELVRSRWQGGAP